MMAWKIAMAARAAARAVAGSFASRRGAGFCIAAASAAVLGAAPAGAEDAQIKSLEARIEQIEARHESEIKSLQAEIRKLRVQRPAAASVVRAPAGAQASQIATQAPTPPPGAPIPQLPPKVVMTYDRGYHFGFSDATGDNTIELFGRLHLDTGGYLSYKPGPATLDQKGQFHDRLALRFRLRFR